MVTRFFSFLMFLYQSVVGNLLSIAGRGAVSSFDYTGSEYSSSLSLSGQKNEFIHFKSRQIKVVRTYSQWWKRRQIGFVYEVQVFVYINDFMTFTDEWTVPHFGPFHLHNTIYPHNFAIDACIDRYKREYGA